MQKMYFLLYEPYKLYELFTKCILCAVPASKGTPQNVYWVRACILGDCLRSCCAYFEKHSLSK